MDGQKPQREEKEANLESNDDNGIIPLPLPPSCTSSPSHEFSFTISLHPSFMPSPKLIKCNEATPSIAVDMAPADDVFFHDHLLPFHFPSHPPISPRASDICIENLSLPLENLRSDGSLKYHNLYNHNNPDTSETRERTKFESFSSFFGLGKWRKASDIGEKEENKKMKKKGFDMSRFLKKYARMVKPFSFFKRESSKRDLHHKPYSFSGRPNPKEKVGWRRRRGEFSAPDSMRTSPTNSGLLSATSMPFNSSDESTMEELQSAIQAAIAHCKNSTATEEKCKS
ncbi:BRI1 kinase inhibitor 1-like [Phoenix dactylifera]|uniref:BRI1 kinase inhibitor 1-like n=1 Tax=Phoenix dactylifera TaxID=42345 RepID=A0A8B8ZM59_PHODC|nr:BRI1 kinase inhibitor 1-like [Phoenix dactylifera]